MCGTFKATNERSEFGGKRPSLAPKAGRQCHVAGPQAQPGNGRHDNDTQPIESTPNAGIASKETHQAKTQQSPDNAGL